MYAIVEISGKQYKIEEGRYYDVDLQNANEGDKLTFDKVLMVSDNSSMNLGQPLVEGASVDATVKFDFKDKKVLVYKQRPKKGYRLKQGHRQQYTRVMIDKINATVAA
jgi:large subunit ribosomal protein L21